MGRWPPWFFGGGVWLGGLVIEEQKQRDRVVDLTMFAGYHLGWLISNGGSVPAVSYADIHEMIDKYCTEVLILTRQNTDDE